MREGSRIARWGAPVVIAIFACVLYSPVLQPDTRFLWDDGSELWGTRGHLVQDDAGPLVAWFPIQEPADGWLDFGAWEPLPAHGFWPLTPTVLWLEWRLFGADDLWASAPDPAARREAVSRIANRFHLPGILLHALNAWLVIVLMRRLEVRGALFVGLVFLAHPVNVASVAWVSELKNTLSLFLALISMLLFLRFVAEPKRSAARWMSLAAFFLSLTAKTSMVGLPVVLTAVLAWRNGGLRRSDLRWLAPHYVMALAMGLVTIWAVGQSGGLSAEVDPPDGPWARLTLAGTVPWFYAFKTLWPVDLMMIYRGPSAEQISWTSFLPGLGIVAIAAIAWMRRRTGGAAVLCALVSLIALMFPVLGFFDMTFMMHSMVSDHLHYASMIPLCALGVGSLFTAADRLGFGALAPSALIGLCILVLANQTFERSFLFKTQRALWTHNVDANSEAWMAHYNLGSLIELDARTLDGDARVETLERALGHLARASELKPAYARAAYREGVVWRDLGSDSDAMEAWTRALEASTRSASLSAQESFALFRDRAAALERLGEPEAALQDYARASILSPAAVRTRMRQAALLLRMGREGGAIVELESVLQRRPRDVSALVGLSRLRAGAREPSLRDAPTAKALASRAMRAAGRDRKPRLAAHAALAAAQAEAARSATGAPHEIDRAWRGAAETARGALGLAVAFEDVEAMERAREALGVISGRGVPAPRIEVFVDASGETSAAATAYGDEDDTGSGGNASP